MCFTLEEVYMCMSKDFYLSILTSIFNTSYYLPYRVACLLTLPVTDLHLFLFCAILSHCSSFKPAQCRMLSLHCSRGLPLPRLPSTMPSSRLRCKLSCLIMCPKKESFLCFLIFFPIVHRKNEYVCFTLQLTTESNLIRLVKRYSRFYIFCESNQL